VSNKLHTYLLTYVQRITNETRLRTEDVKSGAGGDVLVGWSGAVRRMTHKGRVVVTHRRSQCYVRRRCESDLQNNMKHFKPVVFNQGFRQT